LLKTDNHLLIVGGRHVKNQVGVDAGLVDLLRLSCRGGREDGAESGVGGDVGVADGVGVTLPSPFARKRSAPPLLVNTPI